MADFNNPTVTSNYTAFPIEIRNSINAVAVGFTTSGHSNIPTNAIQWDTSANRWKKWSGSAWVELTTTYALTALSTTGTAGFGGNVTVTGTIDATGGITGTSFGVDGTTAPVNGLYKPGTNQIALATNSNPRLYIDATGNVSIGTTAVNDLLNLYGGGIRLQNSNTGVAAGDGSEIVLSSSDLVIKNKETAKISIMRGDTVALQVDSTGTKLSFGTTTSPASAGETLFYGASSSFSQYRNDTTIAVSSPASTGFKVGGDGLTGVLDNSSKNGTIIFKTTNSSGTNATRMTIGSDGTLALNSGTGIDFGGIQTEASGTGITSSQTTLDHYEEGEWTPAYTTDSGTITYVAADTKGRYTRIGNVCYIFFSIRVNTVSSVSGGTFEVSGLPFAVASVSGSPLLPNRGGASSVFASWWNSALSGFDITGWCMAGTTTMRIGYASAGNGFAAIGFPVSYIHSGVVGSFLQMEGSYIVS